MPARAEIRYPIEHTKTEPISTDVAIYLPGQDARKSGMLDLVENDPAGMEVIERANRFLYDKYHYKISEIAGPNGDLNTLRRSEFTQAAVFTLSIALHNKYKYQNRKGYATRPAAITGSSMAMVMVAYLSGSIRGDKKMDAFEQALNLAVMRGRDMELYGSKIPTSMFVVNADRARVDRLLVDYPLLDLCLINAPDLFVVGGPDRRSDDPVQKAKDELKQEKKLVIPVDTDRSLHGRWVSDAKGEFCKVLDKIKFRDPLIPAVGTYNKSPDKPKAYIKTAQGMIDELKYGFDNPFDNWGILDFFDKEKIQLISEVNERGTFAKIVERYQQGVTIKKLGTAVAIALGITAAGVGIYEVLTRHHPHNKQ